MLKVFLVEDEAVIREGIKKRIPWEQYGFSLVGLATDGEMALPLIRKEKPDLLITDIKMPFMDGLSLSKIVREEFPQMKIVIISGHDDFEYARQAIRVGVDQYLLKPITRSNLRNILLEMKEKIEQGKNQKDFQIQFQNEMHEYEQFSRRYFFEMLFEGEKSLTEIYKEAKELSIDIMAPCYNLIFLYIQEKGSNVSESDVDVFIRIQEEILHYFLRRPQYILFRWNVNSFGILVKADSEEIADRTERGVEHIKRLCNEREEILDWHLAFGPPVERLSLLSDCYQEVSRLFAYRFIKPEIHVLSGETLKDYINIKDNEYYTNIKPAIIAPEVMRDFLEKGGKDEIHEFVQTTLYAIKEALNSKMFLDYMILNVHFTIISFIESIGGAKEEYESEVEKNYQDLHIAADEVYDFMVSSLGIAVRIRDKESNYKRGKILTRALSYIDENFSEDSLSLGKLAKEIEVSPNYLSSIFSQNMQKTFIEYVTDKRIEKAKSLLRTTSLTLGDIALEIGYKDSHYFSFVFKKVEGRSPREYRNDK